MNNELMIALFGFAGTAVGTIGGIIASAKLTTYRIQQLEKKVDKHNGFAEKIPVLTAKVEAIEKEIAQLQQHCENHHLKHGDS